MVGRQESGESRIAVLVDCDNVQPAILDHALRFVAQFGRVVARRGYGNSGAGRRHSGGQGRSGGARQLHAPHRSFLHAQGLRASGLLDMLRTYDLLKLRRETGGHWAGTLNQERIAQMPVNPLTGKPSPA